MTPAPHATRIAIEQAIARGEATAQICDTLAVAPSVVADVLRAMEEAVAVDNAQDMPDLPPPRPERHPHEWWPERKLRPCGTHAAYSRHRGRGEPVDDQCLTAERDYQREKRRRLRAARRDDQTGEERSAA